MRTLIFLLCISCAHADFKTFDCSNSDVDSLEEICTVALTYQYSQCQLSFTVGTNALTDFDISFQTGNRGYILEHSVSADYTSPDAQLYWVSSDLTNAGTSGTHSLILTELLTTENVRFSAAGTNSVINGTLVCN